jgi:hypothetical protein
MSLIATPTTPPPAQAVPASVLAFVPEILQSPTHLGKLMTTLPLHRVLIIFLSSNPAIFVALPALEIVVLCLDSPNEDVFQRKFESEVSAPKEGWRCIQAHSIQAFITITPQGGFVLLARVLAAVWNSRTRELVFRGLLGPEGPTDNANVRARMLPCVLAALEKLLQTACDVDEASSRPTAHRPRSATTSRLASPSIQTASSPISVGKRSSGKQDFLSILLTCLAAAGDSALSTSDELSPLLDDIIHAYTSCQGFRKIFTNNRVEGVIPLLTDFISLSASPANVTSDIVDQRQKVKEFIEAIINTDNKLPTLIRSQVSRAPRFTACCFSMSH